MTSRVSPGASSRRTWWEPIGCQPCAIESPDEPALHGDRAVPAAVRAEERVALRVEAGQRLRAGEVREVVAPLAVLGLVVDDAVVDLDLARREVALEVGGVVLGVPQAELDRAEQRQAGRHGSLVGDPGPPDLELLPERHEVERLRADPGMRRPDDRVAQPVPAGVVLELALDRLPARAPVVARSRRRGGTGSGRRRRAARCCSGSGSAAGGARRGRTSSRRPCSR